MNPFCFLLSVLILCSFQGEAGFIEEVRKELPPESTSSFIDQSKKELPEYDQSSYIEMIRKEESLSPNATPSFIEKIKSQLEPKIASPITIHPEPLPAVKESKSAQAFGFRYAVSSTRAISANADTQAIDFESVYGNHYAPDLGLFYEFQLIRSPIYGSFGLTGWLGFSYMHGQGKFAFAPSKPGGGAFSSESDTRFQFFFLPATLAATYRFSLMKYIKPYISVGPSLLGYVEMRNDSRSGFKGFSQGYQVSGGLAILLDWLTPKASWELYSSQGIHEFSLTLDYQRLGTFSGDVHFATQSFLLGFVFEY